MEMSIPTDLTQRQPTTAPPDYRKTHSAELAADESYTPVMHPAHDYPEVTPYPWVWALCWQ